MICSYLLHECDAIRIFELFIEERGVRRVLLCSLKMRMMPHHTDLPQSGFSLNYQEAYTEDNRKQHKNERLEIQTLSHVSRKPLQCIQVTAPYAGHIVEVTFRSHYNPYHLFSDTTRLSSSLFNGGKIMLYSNISSNL